MFFRLPDDEVGPLRVGELDPAVLRDGPGHLYQGRFDPLRDLRLLLVGSALEPVDVDEGHGLFGCMGWPVGRAPARREPAPARPRGGASASPRSPSWRSSRP